MAKHAHAHPPAPAPAPIKKGTTEERATLLKAIFQKAKLKATPPRREILKRMSGGCRPLSAVEIHAELTPGLCDLVTVYRTTETFEKCGILRRCDFADGIVRYEMVPDQNDHHHHLICTACKKVESVEIERCPTRAVEKAAKAAGYRLLRHSFEIFGICPACQ